MLQIKTDDPMSIMTQNTVFDEIIAVANSSEDSSEKKVEVSVRSSNSSVRVQLSDLASNVQSIHAESKVSHGRRVESKIKPKTPLERVFGRHHCYSEHYFTSGSGINENNRRDVLKEPSPFMKTDDENVYSYKVISEAWRDRQRRTELGLKYNERNSYKSRQQLDILSRLFVEEPAVQTVKTILDIDPEFFTIVEGRPIVEKFNVRDYIENVRKVLRTRIVTGFREDDVLQIEENFIEEEKLIDKIKTQYQIYVDMFEEFLADDHTKSMNLLKESEREAALAFQLYETFREMSKDFGALKSSVYNLEEKWRNCKMYQKFLYMISPLAWRRQYDYFARAEGKKEGVFSTDGADDDGASLALDNFSSIFTRYQVISGGEVSFDEMITMFLEDCEIKEPPVLYFSEPEELMKVFRFSELQNLNALLHSEELAGPLENIKEGMFLAQQKFDDEITSLNDMINNLEGDILWEEERAKSLEELARCLIDTSFRRLISAEEILNWYVFVEDVYETRIAPNDANLTACDMMRAIEIKYRDFLIKLDGLPQNKVHKAEIECYTEEAKIMAIAEEASKKVIQIERMTKHLNRILEPPFVKKSGCKYTRHRRSVSKKQWDKHKQKDSGHKTISTEETELLEIFTDYCKHTDDPNSYQLDDLIKSLAKLSVTKSNHEKSEKLHDKS